MNAKLFFTILTVCLISKTGFAQNHESTDSLTRELQEVIITAKQPATKLIGTTLVSTVAGTNLADLGNALDVLAQLPMIKVQDNTVSVIGRNDIEIYIDGRPVRDDNELPQLLSSDIKKVELLLAPGPVYESTTGAVLKITTKRRFTKGVSVTDQFQLQRRRKWSFTDYLALGYRSGNWETFVNGTVNRNNSLAKGTTINSLIYDGKKTVVGSSQRNSYPTTTGVIKAGFNFTNESQSFGAYYRYNPESGDFRNSGSEWCDNDAVIKRNIIRRIHSQSHLVSVYYENIFGGKYRLHFDGDFRVSHSDSDVSTTYPSSAVSDVRSTDNRASTLWAGKLYLNFPLCNGEFSIGTQDSYTHTTLNYCMLNQAVGQYIPSSLTEARQSSAALFALWSRLFGKFSISAGARYEYVDYNFKVNGKRDEDVSRRNHLLTPDISLSYTFDDDSRLSLSYKMATVKPPYSQLTGSLSYVGLHEIEGGNPTLRDEKMHYLQLLGMYRGFMIQGGFTRAFDTYAYVKQLYPADNLQLLMHPVNIDVSALSLYLIWSQPIKNWTPDITIGMYRQWLSIDQTRYDKPIFSYYFDNTLSLPHDWMITANMSGRTEGDMHTNRFGTTWFTLDASIGKTFLDKSLTVKLSATDIFNTTNNDWTMNTYGVNVNKRQNYDNRGILLNIIYNFRPYKSKYKGTSASEAELNRL